MGKTVYPAQQRIEPGGLAAVLFRLFADRWCGLVEVSAARRAFKASLVRGRIASIELPWPDTTHLLGAVLVRQGWVRAETVDEAVSRSRSRSRLFGQVLVARGLPIDALWSALKLQARRRLGLLIDRAFGECVLEPGRSPLAGGARLGAPLDTVGELHAALSARTSSWEATGWVRRCAGSRVRIRRWAVEPLRQLDSSHFAMVRALLDFRPIDEVAAGWTGNEGFFYFLERIGALEVYRPADQSSRQREVRPDLTLEPRRRSLRWSSAAELKRWWRAQARACHPDLQPGADEATRAALCRRFEEAAEIYRRNLAQMEA
jgi:hypothetical protein